MKKKIALVTGGAGFIGSHLVDLLIKKNFKVRVIDNFEGGHEKNLRHHKKNKLDLLKININNLDENNKFFKNVDFVYHLAGIGDIVPSIENPNKYFKTNVIGTANVLRLCKEFKIKKIVYAASSSCYGIATTPTKETHDINPLYPYALSKYQGEQLVRHWGGTYNLDYNVIRIFNAYGTRVKTTGAYGAVFGVFLKQKLENKPFTVVGDGSQKRDFVYVTDVANAFYKASISKVKNEIFNLGFGKPSSIKQLVDILKGDIVYLPKRPGEPDITWADISKIKKLLKWEPKINFKQGVQLMLDEINYWSDAPLWNKSNIKIATKTWFKYMDKYK